MKNNGLLIIAIIVLLGVIGFLVYDRQEPKSAGEEISDSINEVVEEVEDEIDDNTTDRR